MTKEVKERKLSVMLGLVHEVVHLQNPDPGDQTKPQERFKGEIRFNRGSNASV